LHVIFPSVVAVSWANTFDVFKKTPNTDVRKRKADENARTIFG
jgi:hypothetical protein